MTIERNSLRHPGVDTALTRSDVCDGVHYTTFLPEREVVQRGVFLSESIYNEQDPRWFAMARLAGKATVVEVWLHDAGITPDGTGEVWAEAVTIPDDTVD